MTAGLALGRSLSLARLAVLISCRAIRLAFVQAISDIAAIIAFPIVMIGVKRLKRV